MGDFVAAVEGPWIVRVQLAGTGILVLGAAGASIAPATFTAAYVVLSLVLFGLGIVTFLWAYAVAVARSRYEVIGIGGLYLLQGSAPRPVQVALLVPVLAQCVVVTVAAAVRIYTPVAFGILAPMFGLGLAGLWAARHGTFPERPDSDDVPHAT